MKIHTFLFVVVTLNFVCGNAWSDNLVFQIRGLEAKSEGDPLGAKVPKDAKMLWSLEVDVQADLPFYCKTTVGDITIKIQGRESRYRGRVNDPCRCGSIVIHSNAITCIVDEVACCRGCLARSWEVDYRRSYGEPGFERRKLL